MNILTEMPLYDAFEHYKFETGPTDEFGDFPETPPSIKNVGWTLGNDCPYRCHHCYSMSARCKGQNMSLPIIDRIIDQLVLNGIETVNLGGNEPLFTNGLDPKDSLLPYIIHHLVESGIEVGLTTSGITLLYLFDNHRQTFDLLNDIDVSLDSPYESEHNKNRGARLYHKAIEALKICQEHDKPHAIIMAGMNWNFDIPHLSQIISIAKKYEANVRINPIKPVEPKHLDVFLPPDMYYAGLSFLMQMCHPVDLGEPPIAAVTDYQYAKRCPCGRTSFRIHSITPDGGVYVSPCVYLHDYKSPLNLLEFDLAEIINTPQFRVFRQRNANPEMIEGCKECYLLSQCGGGCAARSYLYHIHKTGIKSMLAQDPYCPVRVKPSYSFPQRPVLDTHEKLVHMDYLCTWIGRPK